MIISAVIRAFSKYIDHGHPIPGQQTETHTDRYDTLRKHDINKITWQLQCRTAELPPFPENPANHVPYGDERLECEQVAFPPRDELLIGDELPPTDDSLAFTIAEDETAGFTMTSAWNGYEGRTNWLRRFLTNVETQDDEFMRGWANFGGLRMFVCMELDKWKNALQECTDADLQKRGRTSYMIAPNEDLGEMD